MEDQEETIAKLRDGWGASRRRRKSKPSATGRSEAHTQAWRSRRSRWGGGAAVQKMTCVHSLTRIAHSLTLATIAAFRARAIIMRSTPQALVLLICSLPDSPLSRSYHHALPAISHEAGRIPGGDDGGGAVGGAGSFD
jgi:hypothetical protein